MIRVPQHKGLVDTEERLESVSFLKILDIIKHLLPTRGHRNELSLMAENICLQFQSCSKFIKNVRLNQPDFNFNPLAFFVHQMHGVFVLFKDFNSAHIAWQRRVSCSIFKIYVQISFQVENTYLQILHIVYDVLGGNARFKC